MKNLSAARLFAKHHRLVITAALLVVFVVIRLLYLEADPPRQLPNNARILELFTDPPAKSYEARTWALFGAWQTSPEDNYRFWRVQSPVWVYPIALYYKVFGVGYAQLRVFSTLCAAMGLWAMMALAGKRLRGAPLFAAGAFLTFNYYYIIYARSGLLEALLNTFVIAAVYFLYLSRRNVLWLLAATAAVALAFFTKQSGLYVVPLLLGVGFFRARAHLKGGGAPWRVWLPVAVFVVAAGAIAWYARRPDYYRTVAWNYGHMLLDKESVATVDVGSFPLIKAIDRLRVVGVWTKGYFLLFPLEGALAIIEVGRLVVRRIKGRSIHDWDVIVASWLVSSFGVLLLTPHLAVHYRLILFPPVFLAAANLLSVAGRRLRVRYRASAWRRWAGPAVVGASVLASAALSAVYYADWVAHMRHDIIDAEREIKARIKQPDAVFAGVWSGPIIFGTRFQYYYVKAMFNQSYEATRSFHITHVIESDAQGIDDIATRRLKTLFPWQMSTKKPLFGFRLREREVAVFELRYPL